MIAEIDFNIGDLVYQTSGKTFGFGVVVEKINRSLVPDDGVYVYAYKIQFANKSGAKLTGIARRSNFARWLLGQDLELVSKAKR